ncbi:MAG TPA: hypothetical protein VNG94_04010, partial [Pyrinomonadaceae bacterium]|nr:hypothetical protein [Pyrinomonadaceae bacterium]
MRLLRYALLVLLATHFGVNSASSLSLRSFAPLQLCVKCVGGLPQSRKGAKENRKGSEEKPSTGRDAYIFSYFKGNGEDGLHLAYSDDGLVWRPLNGGKSLLQPVVGRNKLMRDPQITLGPDGLFHMVWTTSWIDQVIGYATSQDLINWSRQRGFTPMRHEPTALNIW